MAKRNRIAEYIDSQIGPRVVGGTYWNRYWQETYSVVAIDRNDKTGSWSITVRWVDGRITQHCTGWRPRDVVISQPE